MNIKTYYNSKSGKSLYQWCEDLQVDIYIFDMVKRVVRCRRKGNFKEDLEKTIDLFQIYNAEKTVHKEYLYTDNLFIKFVQDWSLNLHEQMICSNILAARFEMAEIYIKRYLYVTK
jgi:hypothetical protein